MRKLFLVGLIFLAFISSKIKANSTIVFNNVSYELMNSANLPDNPNFSNKVILNIIKFNGNSLNTYIKYGDNGKALAFGIDKNNIETSNAAGWWEDRDDCGNKCAKAETDFGAIICWFACKVGIINRNDEDSEINGISFDWLKDFFRDKFNYCYNFANIPESSYVESKVYSENTLISNSIIGLDNNLKITGICMVGNQDEVQAAHSALGKCIEACGMNAKSNIGAYLCAWDCIFKFNNGKINTPN